MSIGAPCFCICTFARFSPSFKSPAASTATGEYKVATLTKRQKQLIDYLNQYISDHGYAPTLAEVGAYFGLSSLATVHKHLHNLEKKGFITRQHNHSRALEVASDHKIPESRVLKLLGTVAAGAPIEAIEGSETIAVPDEFIRRDNTFCLRVKGDSMIEDHIADGDMVATIKIIPFATQAAPLETALAAAPSGAIFVKPFKPMRIGVVSTTLPGLKSSIVAKTLRVLEARPCRLGHTQVCERDYQPGFTGWGSFAERVHIPVADLNCVRLPELFGPLSR